MLHHTYGVFKANVQCKGIVMADYSEKRCLKITIKAATSYNNNILQKMNKFPQTYEYIKTEPVID